MDWSKFNQFKAGIKGKRVLILGLGLQGGGVGAAKFFHELGATIRISDLKNQDQLAPALTHLSHIVVEKYTFNKNNEEDVDWADLIIVNPDLIHKTSTILNYAISRNKHLDMETSLFVKLSPVDIIGITGTRGKTTTAVLTYELCQSQYPSIVAGNVTGSETLTNLFKIKQAETKIILELSSFQLRSFHWSKIIFPHISLITNIYEDHLNTYRTMQDYIQDKKAIYLYQKPSDYLILNQRQQNYDFAKEAKSQISFFSPGDVKDYDIKLGGEHNLENFAAAHAIANLVGVDDRHMRKVFNSFCGVPFRQQIVRVYRDVTFINDTTATTPTAAIKALEAHKNNKIILICGGNSKNCHDDEFAQLAAKTCKKIIFLKGNATAVFRSKIIKSNNQKNLVSDIFDDFPQAVQSALSVALPGDYIILSPGFTSFGMFENEFDRGRQFNQIVQNLK